MADSLNILIKALLEKQSKDNIVKEIQQIQDVINNKPLLFKVKIDGNEFKQLSANLSKISSDMSK